MKNLMREEAATVFRNWEEKSDKIEY